MSRPGPTREIRAFDGPMLLPLAIEYPWLSGEADFSTFYRDATRATKLRVLLPRDQWRDLYDSAHAMGVFANLDVDRVVEIFGCFMVMSGRSIFRAQSPGRMFAKLANPRFLLDVCPVLSGDRSEALIKESRANLFCRVFTMLVDRLLNEPRGKAAAIKKGLGIGW